jgi:hypothetical protein
MSNDHTMHLRHLLQALQLVADTLAEEQGQQHVNEALYGITNAMWTHVIALEEAAAENPDAAPPPAFKPKVVEP